MTKSILLLFLLTICSLTGFSQKFGYVDSEYITSKMPEHKKAKEEMTKYTEKWTNEIEEKYKEIEKLQRQYRVEEVLLTEEMKQERLIEIKKKETELKDYQKKVFGFGGLFFLKKQELIKPLQDKVWEAVEKVAKQNRLAIIFDKSGELVMIYTDPRHDYTDFVLEELGLGDPNDKIK